MTCLELIRKLRPPSVVGNKPAYPKSWYLQGFYSNWENSKCPLAEFHLYQFHSEYDKSIRCSSFKKTDWRWTNTWVQWLDAPFQLWRNHVFHSKGSLKQLIQHKNGPRGRLLTSPLLLVSNPVSFISVPRSSNSFPLDAGLSFLPWSTRYPRGCTLSHKSFQSVRATCTRC